MTFGDSITDGDQSTPDTLGMWPAVLAARLQATARPPASVWSNAGDFRQSRARRQQQRLWPASARDVLAVPGVRWMTMMEGINDITGATRSGQAGKTFTAETLIAAYRQVIETAHAHGVQVIGCTLTPYGGSNVFTDEGEAIRQAVNAWIRTGGGFDGVIDFDAATRDPADAGAVPRRGGLARPAAPRQPRLRADGPGGRPVAFHAPAVRTDCPGRRRHINVN